MMGNPKGTRYCLNCREHIYRWAFICPHCHTDPTVKAPPNYWFYVGMPIVFFMGLTLLIWVLT